MIYAIALLAVSPIARAHATEPRHLLPSEVSELQYVYESLRAAARQGNVQAYTSHFDPQSLVTTATDERGNPLGLTETWLRAHASEWPDIDSWEFIEMRTAGEWARLLLRHPHNREGEEHSKRWDLYVLVYRQIGETWRLTRRAILITPGRTESPPTADDVSLPLPYGLPPR